MISRDRHQSSTHSARLSGAERRAVGVLAGIFAVRMLGLFLLLPVLALYAAGLPGARPELIGLAVGAYGMTQAILQIPFGIASDRWGRRPVIAAGLLLFCAGSLLAAFDTSLLALIVGRALQGAGAISAAVTALLADHLREERRTRAMAVLGLGIGGSFVLSMMLGPALAAWIGVPGVFLLTAGLAVGALLLLLALPEAPSPLDPAPIRRGALASLGGPLLGVDAGIFLLHFMLTATFVAVPFLLEGRSGGQHSSLYALALVGSLAGTVPLILWSERSPRPARAAALAIAALVGAELTLALAGGSGVGPLLAALMLFFAGFNFLEARLPAELARLAPMPQRGAAMGIYATAQFLGAFVGGAGGGLALAAGGLPAVFGLCAAAGLLWLALEATRARSTRTESRAEPVKSTERQG